jgi:hypothetical protein
MGNSLPRGAKGGYIKPDGNIGNCIEFPFQWKGLTTGARKALMRDIVKEIVLIAESSNCTIAKVGAW